MVNPDTDPLSLFGKGTQVEVSSDDEGFKGAWYRATIVESSLKSVSKKRKKALVEYKYLVTEDGSTPLTEYIEPAYIRPLPPEEDTEVGFEEYDSVEARCRDGWWTGVVRKVLENSTYLVYFDNPPDVIEFERKDLRSHLEWVDGKWVRPEKQQPTGSIFSSGTAVEVNLNKENLRDVWFPAIVIKENEDNTFLVKYPSSRDIDEAWTIKVTVDNLHIRPSPPCYVDRNYELLERVDTTYDVGWRAGVITKVLAGRRYIVFFKHGNEDKELSHSEIRPHMEWSDGKWVSRLSKSKEVLITSNGQEHLGLANNGTNNPEVAVELESPCGAKDNTEEKTPCSTSERKKWMEQPTPCDENYALPSRKKKIKLAASNGKTEHSYPSKELNEGKAAEALLSITASQLSKMPNETSTKEACRGLATPRAGLATPRTGLATPRTGLATPRTGSGTRGSRKPIIGDQPSAKSESPFTRMTVKKGKSRFLKIPIKGPLESATGEEDSEGIAAAKEINDVEGKAKEVDVPVILGLKAKGLKGPQAGNPSEIPSEELLKLMREKDRLNDSAGYKSMEIKEQKSGGSSQRRKRGRPRKLVVVSPEPSEAGKEYNGAGGVADEIVVKDLITNEVELPTLPGVEPAVCQDTCRQKAAEVFESDCNTKEVEMAIAEVSNNTADDDQPLSMWIGGIHSTGVEELRLSSGRTVNGLNDVRENQISIEMESSAKESSVLDDNQRLPFVKRSPIWKTIESMEVFKLVPQRPHFRPLYESKEEYREGSAIGIMVTFAGLFEKIATLQFDDPGSIFQSILESLLDLERHGFDVTVPRGRVDELLLIKDGQGQILDESQDAKREIMGHTNKKTKFDEEMEEIRRKITELEEQYVVIKSKKETSDLEIARLQLHVGDLSGLIQSARCKFQKVASALWKLP